LVGAVQGYIRYLRACATDEATSADYERERARLTKMKADNAELDHAYRKQRLVDIDVVIDGVQQANARVRNQLMSLPQRLAPRAAPETDVTAVQEIAQEIVTDILAELSDPNGVCRDAQRQGSAEAD
jgi:phage terminase Nu1 subunit (DNA packaging protein)